MASRDWGASQGPVSFLQASTICEASGTGGYETPAPTIKKNGRLWRLEVFAM